MNPRFEYYNIFHVGDIHRLLFCGQAKLTRTHPRRNFGLNDLTIPKLTIASIVQAQLHRKREKGAFPAERHFYRKCAQISVLGVSSGREDWPLRVIVQKENVSPPGLPKYVPEL